MHPEKMVITEHLVDLGLRVMLEHLVLLESLVKTEHLVHQVLLQDL